MRNSMTQTEFKFYQNISLENDKPFSMSSESDKEVLLFPLTSDVEIEPRSENNIYRMIEESERKCKKEEIEKEKKQPEVGKQLSLISEIENFCLEKTNEKLIERARSDEKENEAKVRVRKNVIIKSEYNHLVKIQEGIGGSIDVIKNLQKFIENDKNSNIDIISSSGESTYNPAHKNMYAPIGNGKKRGPYKKFSQLQKQVLVDQAKRFGISYVVKKEQIARKTLCRWISDGVVRRYGGGRQVGDSQMELKLMQIIHQHFNKSMEVMEKQKIQDLARQLSSNSLFTASHGWFQKFYLRHRKSFETMLKYQGTTKKQNS